MSQKVSKVNYNKSIIYKLCCKDINITEIYIGSTTNFKNRKNKHKWACNNINSKSYNYYVYKFIREHGGFENWDMIMICEYSCENKKELEKKEREYIELHKATLNKQIPTRTDEEYYNDNQEYKKKYHKEYYNENKERISENKKEYYNENKEIIKDQQKVYQEKNKERISENKKEYYEKNKIKITCEFCNAVILKHSLKKHQKSLTCQKYNELFITDD